MPARQLGATESAGRGTTKCWRPATTTAPAAAAAGGGGAFSAAKAAAAAAAPAGAAGGGARRFVSFAQWPLSMQWATKAARSSSLSSPTPQRSTSLSRRSAASTSAGVVSGDAGSGRPSQTRLGTRQAARTFQRP